jgi:anti-anti-sigma factor
MMLVCRDEAGKAIYVTPGGDLVAVEVQAMRRQLLDCIWQGTERLVLDLARVRRIDNDGLETIIAVYNRIREGGGELIIENASRDLKDLFWLMRHDGRLTISRTGWPRRNDTLGSDSSGRLTRCRLSWRRSRMNNMSVWNSRIF